MAIIILVKSAQMLLILQAICIFIKFVIPLGFDTIWLRIAHGCLGIPCVAYMLLVEQYLLDLLLLSHQHIVVPIGLVIVDQAHGFVVQRGQSVQ